MSVSARLAGARWLWTTAGGIGLDTVDRVKYGLSWYLSRLPGATAAASHFRMKVPGPMCVFIRPNGVDYRTLADIFGRRVYDIGPTAASRVLDLGANIGLATVRLASRFPGAEFACVEPSPSNRATLKKAIRANGIRARILEGAIGVSSGQADLQVGCDSDMFSLVPAVKSALTLRVRQFTVEEVMNAMGWEEIDLLKIDIEGYEKTLFRENNAWLNRVKAIVGEAHGHVGYGIDEVRADLEPFGFAVKLASFEAQYGLTLFEAYR